MSYTAQVTKILNQFKHHDQDNGSAECQIIRLHYRIKYLNDHHLQTHKKDIVVKRQIVKLVSQLNSFKKYLFKNNPTKYCLVRDALGMRK